MGKQIGKSCKIIGVTPSIILNDPKYAHNVAYALRLASCYGFKQVWYTGDRVRMDIEAKGRMPREERMKGYNDVDLINFDYPFDQFENAVPVGVELRPNAENILDFEHPENSVYVFGPEDGSLSYVCKSHCHRFIYVPTFHCLSVSHALSAVMTHRMTTYHKKGDKAPPHIADILKEERRWTNLGLFSQGESV